jgi:hypothetical protein
MFNQVVAIFNLTIDDAFHLIKNAGNIVTTMQINSILVPLSNKKAINDERLSYLATVRLVDGLAMLPQFKECRKTEITNDPMIDKLLSLFEIDAAKYEKLSKGKTDEQRHEIHSILDKFI